MFAKRIAMEDAEVQRPSPAAIIGAVRKAAALQVAENSLHALRNRRTTLQDEMRATIRATNEVNRRSQERRIIELEAEIAEIERQIGQARARVMELRPAHVAACEAALASTVAASSVRAVALLADLGNELRVLAEADEQLRRVGSPGLVSGAGGMSNIVAGGRLGHIEAAVRRLAGIAK